VHVETVVRDGNLSSILLLLSSRHHKAIGMMSRSAGLDEERLELVGSGGRRAVLNLSETIAYDGAQVRSRRDDWAATSLQRGFDAMCAHFLDTVRHRRPADYDDILETHRICELIVRHAEKASPSGEMENPLR
jgi:virulence factor